MPRIALAKAEFQFVPQQLVFDTFAKASSPGKEPELPPDRDFPVADILLSTLRTCFSRTYYDASLLADPLSAIMAIRNLASHTLRQFPSELTGLKLAPVGLPIPPATILLYKLVVAPSAVVEGVIHPSACRPADPVFHALRTIVSLTFSEVHGAHECARTLEQMRAEGVKTLLTYNDLLEYLDLELVAPPRARRAGRPRKAFAADLPETVQHWWMDSPSPEATGSPMTG